MLYPNLEMKLILDTNIYRNLVRDLNFAGVKELSKLINRKCKEKGVKILFPINPAMELISHYNDTIDKERIECRNALKLLVTLSTTFLEAKAHVDFVAPLNSVLEQYFGGQYGVYTDMYMQVIDLSQILSGNIPSPSKYDINSHIEIVKRQIEYEKDEIRENYEKYLKSINNGNIDWTFFSSQEKREMRKKYFSLLRNGHHSFLVAESMVDRAHNMLKMGITKDEAYFELIMNFIREFCPGIVMNEILLENIGHGVEAIKDVTDKRWNTIIDISLIFGALFNPKDEERKLVTEEKNIHKSYNECKFIDKILNLDDFKQLLEL